MLKTPMQEKSDRLKLFFTSNKKLLMIFSIFIILVIFTTSLFYYPDKQKSLKVTNVQDVKTTQSLDLSQIDKLITDFYYDNDLKKPIRNKFGIIKDKSQASFFISDNDLNPESIKILHSLPSGSSIEYIDVAEIVPGYVFAIYKKNGGIDIAIADKRGNLITPSLRESNPEYTDWAILHPEYLEGGIKYLGARTISLILSNNDGEKAYLEVDVSSGKAIKESLQKLPILQDPFPIKYYKDQFGETYKFNGFDYVLVQRPSMNFTISKSTNYAGVLRKPSGTSEWEEYIKITSSPNSAKNNPYKLWFDNGLYLLIVDQMGGGSGDGNGKLIKIIDKIATLINCIDYTPEQGKESLGELINREKENNEYCNNYSVVFK